MESILDGSRAYNAAHGITGLLLCSDGCFVQVLEGGETAVHALYDRIQRDPRHGQVVTVRQGLGPQRFAEWSMGFGYVQARDLQQALAALDATEPRRAPGVSVPQLRALLDAFG